MAAPRQRARQATKRLTFPWINSQIIAVSEKGELHLLLSAIEAYLHQMNLVNMSTALHRLAKMTTGDEDTQANLRQTDTFVALLSATSEALSKADRSGTTPHSQALSNIVWSLATMRCVDLELLKTAAVLSHRHMLCFKPFELSTALWSFAKLGTFEDDACRCAKSLFEAARGYIPHHVEEFTFRCLVTTAWAFATARHYDAALFNAIAGQMVPVIHTANCQELANTAWAFGTAGSHQERLFSELARRALPRLGEFKAQELSNMLWGLATGGYFNEGFYVAASMAVQRLELQAPQLSNILWALSRARPRHPMTKSTVLALLPACTRLMETFKPQELSSVALAVAKAQEPLSPQPFGMRQPLQSQVVDFFVMALNLVVHYMQVFSAQSLANVATAYLMVQVGGETELFSEINNEVQRRLNDAPQSLETSVLLLLLRGLPGAPRGACQPASKALFVEAAVRIGSMQQKEVQILSRICSSLCGPKKCSDLSREAVAKLCCALSNNGTRMPATGWPGDIGDFLESTNMGQAADTGAFANRGVLSNLGAGVCGPRSADGVSPRGSPRNGAQEWAASNGSPDTSPTAACLPQWQWAPGGWQPIPISGDWQWGMCAPAVAVDARPQPFCDDITEEALQQSREQLRMEEAARITAISTSSAEASHPNDTVDMNRLTAECGWVCSVKNSFLHFELSSASSEAGDSSTSAGETENEALEKTSFVAQRVSLTDAERDAVFEFRAKYRAWRKLESRGAKGEIGSLLPHQQEQPNGCSGDEP